MTLYELTHCPAVADSASTIADLAGGLFDGAIQNPYNGMAQPIGLPEIHVVDNSKKADIVKQFGISAGTVLPFLIMRAALRTTGGAFGWKTPTGIMGLATESGATGAVMGIALTPVDNHNSIWDTRMKAAGVNAATFFTLGLAGSALASTSSLASGVGWRSVPINVVRNGLAGMPGGFVNVEANSLASHHQLDFHPFEVGKGVFNYMAFEGLLGAFDSFNLQGTGEVETKTTDEIAQRFPAYSEQQLATGRAVVVKEMSVVRASSDNGRSVSVMDKLNQSNLSGAQKERILNSLAAVRENYTTYRDATAMDADQAKNWIHTQGELGRVLDSARMMKLTANETEDAMLASMFSDAVKTKANFTVHHLDGAKAAQEYLSRYLDHDFTPDRLQGIVQAIKEHQIGPPGFMSMIYTGRIRAALLAEKGAGTGTAQGAMTPAKLTAEEEATLSEIGKKIANPFAVPLTNSGEGGKMEIFSPEETALLRRTGIDKWYVPDPSTPWYRSSRSLINGDSIDNYATPGGFSKIVGLNGPESDIFFKDKTIDGSLASPRRSFKQAYEIMTPEGKQLADAELTNTDAAILRAKGRVEQWLYQQKSVGASEELPSIPYWNADLAYPLRPTEELEQNWWSIHRTAPKARTAEQQQLYNQHQYDGLSPSQITDFQFAKVIRDRLVDELRREQRLDGELPPDFTPVMTSGVDQLN